MGAFLSSLKTVSYFRSLRYLARRMNFEIEWEKEIEKFHQIHGTRLNNLKLVFNQVGTENNITRLLAFVRFAEELKLSEEEWAELYIFFSR